MKRKLILILVLLAVGLSVYYFATVVFRPVNVDFATKATLRYDYVNKHLNGVAVTDADLRALKGILRGRSFPDSPSCGFGMDVSITFTDGRKSITFCPACDGCNNIRIGETNKYIHISEPERERIDSILAKYGMKFPCI